MVRRLRGLLGLIVLLALAVGLPWALASTIGNPLHRWSSIASGDMSDQDVIAVLAMVAYVAWATFAIAVIVELAESVAARIGARPRRQLRIPLLGVQQDLARSLIAVVLLLGPAVVSMAVPVVSAAAAPHVAVAASAPHRSSSTSVAQRATLHEAPATSATTTTTTYVIPDSGGLRSYWALAEHYYGDGQRWPEIWHANEHRTQADGSVMDTPRQLQRGWTVLVPVEATADTGHGQHQASGHHDVTVHRGDTLSGLAAADGVKDWTAVWPANAGRAEPDGLRLTDPNVIRPGWTISLPGSTAAKAAPTHHVPAEQEPSRPHPAPPQTHTPAPPPARHVPVPASPEGRTAAGDGSQESRGGGQAAHSQASASRHAQPEIVTVAEWIATLGAGAGVLAAGTYVALRRYRRRQFRHRRPGRMVAGPAPEHVPLEKVLVTEGASGVRDIEFIDRALRALAAKLVDVDAQLPPVIAARLTSQHLDLVLAAAQEQAPPAPWVSVSATSWMIDKTADLPMVDEYDHIPAAPYPSLVSVGYTPAGEEWLIDLEQAGALAFDGDPERCLDLARFTVAELAHNLWSDHLTVTLAGFGEELVGLNPGRLSYTDDVVAAVAAATNDVEATRAVEDTESIDVLQGRLRGVSGDTWMPQVLVLAPSWAEDRADAAAVGTLLESLGQRDSRTAVAVVVTGGGDQDGAEHTGLHLTVHPDGTLLIPELDVIAAAQRLPADQAEELAVYLELARDQDADVAMPPAADDTPVAAYADLAGALRPEHTVTSPIVAVTTAAVSGPTSIVVAPAAVVPIAGVVAREPAPGVCAAVETADPTLDADLAAWHDPASVRPKLRLLGPHVELTATGPHPDKYKTAIVVEAVTYLALHPRGVTGDKFAADFWPEMSYTIRDSNPKNTMSLAGTWLGVDPVTGQRYLPYAKSPKGASGTGLYRLNGLLVDADLFRRLRTRGDARGGVPGHADHVAALALVGGVPLAGLRKEGRSWLVHDGVADENTMTAAVVDLAADVVDHALAANDLATADRAARTARDTGTASDRPLIDLARVCEAQGRSAELVATVRQIQVHHDAEVEEDIPSHTYDELLRRGYIGIAS